MRTCVCMCVCIVSNRRTVALCGDFLPTSSLTVLWVMRNRIQRGTVLQKMASALSFLLAVRCVV
mgnify:CR=1 FL=1